MTPEQHKTIDDFCRVILREGAIEEGQKATDRAVGIDWPKSAETMIGRARLDNFVSCIASVVEEGLQGDVLEAGVWRGGACIVAREVLRVLEPESSRRVFLADSFCGLPLPDAARYPVDEGDLHHIHAALRISLEEVRGNFSKYGLLDDRVIFLPGWFEDTLSKAPIEALSVFRLDGDMYSSTMQTLDALYDKLVPGGFCIIDDYALKGAYTAVNDYRAQHGIVDPIHQVDWTGIWWKKGCT